MTEKEVTPERVDEMIEWIVKQVEKRRLFAPVVFALEAGQPLSFVGSQMAMGFSPFASVLGSEWERRVKDYAYMFEDRRNLNKLINALERRSAEVSKEDKEKRKEAKRLRAERRKKRKED